MHLISPPPPALPLGILHHQPRSLGLGKHIFLCHLIDKWVACLLLLWSLFSTKEYKPFIFTGS